MREAGVINENLRHALAAFSFIARPGHLGGCRYASFAYAGVRYGLFNTVALTQPPPDPDHVFPAVLERAQQFFAPHETAWSFWLCEDFLPADVRRRCRLTMAGAGLKLLVETPGMITTELTPARGPLPELDCRRVGDFHTRSDFSDIMSEAFQVPEDMSREVYGGERLWTSPMIGWVAYVRHEPVATTCVVTAGDAIGLYAVATRPRYQRRGYGEALVRYAVNHARRATGLKEIVLQSSAAGHALYQRLGFRDVTRFAVFAS
jgi:GNAT superfamily N-acetyltransferase